MNTPVFYTRVLFCTLLVAINALSAQTNTNILEKRITIHSSEIRLDSLLKLFVKQTGLEFSFNSNKISPSKKINVTKKDQSVAQWLANLENTLGIHHKLVGNHIILIDGGKRPTPKIQRQNTSTSVNEKTRSNQSNFKPVVDTSKERKSTVIGDLNSGNSSTVDSLGQSDDLNKVELKDTTNLTIVSKRVNKHADSSAVHALIDKPTLKTPMGGSENVPNANEQEAEHSIQVLLGYSKHGSGDMKGIVFGTEYNVSLSRRFSLGFILRGTINNSKHSIIVDNQTSGTKTDASVRFTTAGVQLGAVAHWHIVRSKKHDLALSLGPFGRYQSASNGSDGYSVYGPQSTGLPVVLIGYDNHTPQNTLALGGMFQIQYCFSLSEKLFIGTLGAIQTDTNGDLIPQVGLVFGRKYK